jgi:DNA-binding XRE family transcriptional regulator
MLGTGCVFGSPKARRLHINATNYVFVLIPSGSLPPLRSPSSDRMMRCLMVIGERLRELRENKMLSQGDIERKTGLLRCYISRVENGHTVPNIETLVGREGQRTAGTPAVCQGALTNG